MNSWLIFSICKCFFRFGGVGGILSPLTLSRLVPILFSFELLFNFLVLGGIIWPLCVRTSEQCDSENFFFDLGGTINPLWVLTNCRFSTLFLKFDPKFMLVRSWSIETIHFSIKAKYFSFISRGIHKRRGVEPRIYTTEKSLLEKIDSRTLLLESCVMSSYFESIISDCRVTSFLYTLWQRPNYV